MYGWETLLQEKYTNFEEFARCRIGDVWFVFESLRAMEDLNEPLVGKSDDPEDIIQFVGALYMKKGLPQNDHLSNNGACGTYLCIDEHQKVARPICKAKYAPDNTTLLGKMLVNCTNTPAPGI